MKSGVVELVHKNQKNTKRYRQVLLIFGLAFLGACFFFGWMMWPYIRQVGLDEALSSGHFIHISKKDFRLTMYESKTDFIWNSLSLTTNGLVREYRVSVGRNSGDKERPGDLRTPVGVFPIEEFYDSSTWTHDFGDGKLEIPYAYGPWFMELRTGWDGIGIHGTHDNSSIGEMKTEGCVRLVNDEVLELKEYVHKGTLVLITP